MMGEYLDWHFICEAQTLSRTPLWAGIVAIRCNYCVNYVAGIRGHGSILGGAGEPLRAHGLNRAPLSSFSNLWMANTNPAKEPLALLGGSPQEGSPPTSEASQPGLGFLLLTRLKSGWGSHKTYPQRPATVGPWKLMGFFSKQFISHV